MRSIRCFLTCILVLNTLRVVTCGAEVQEQEKAAPERHLNRRHASDQSHSRPSSRLLRRHAVDSNGVVEKSDDYGDSDDQYEERPSHKHHRQRHRKRGAAVDDTGHVHSGDHGRGYIESKDRGHARGISARRLSMHSIRQSDATEDAGPTGNATAEEDEDEEEETDSDEEEADEDDGAVQDCEYNDWGKWTQCSETCGGGSRKRTRTVKTKAQNGGKACEAAEKKQTEECNTKECPVDCVISDWQDWGHCAPNCQGHRKRNRMIIQAASHGGQACGDTKEEESCDGVCTDCEYEDWSSWVECSVTCGGGNQNRTRDVAVPPTNGGKACVGNKTETRVCGNGACPVDCELTDWSNWTACEPYCAGNTSRHRTVKTLPMNGGVACGALNETQKCTNFCMDCSWSDWTAWTNCTVSCGGGTMNRSRDQTFVATGGGGAALLQLAGSQVFGFEMKASKRCDAGHQASDALPLAEAQEKCKVSADCQGLSDLGCDGKQVVLCTSGFVLEEDVSACAYNKKEIGGGKPCTGDGIEKKNCSTDPCPVDCGYSDWAEWSACEPYCSGNKTRGRSIVTEAAHGGVACTKEELKEQKACANFCMDCQVLDWTEWDACSVTCGGGRTNRTRTETYVNRPNLTAGSLLEVGAASAAFGYEKRLGVRCTAESLGPKKKEFLPARAERKCSNDPTCYALYDRDCDGGLRFCGADFELVPEEGSCVYVKKEIGEGVPCDGKILEGSKCNIQKCPIDCKYKDWSDWGSCNPLCEGTRNRSREVKKYAAFGGQPCDNKTQSEECTNVCVDCEWSDWTAWTNCSATCGGGMQERGRGIAVDVEGYGKNCTGDAEEKQKCNTQDCPVDCETSDWSSWSSCEPFCKGMQNQTRTITLEAANGGMPCGPLFHSRACNNTCLDCVWANWTEWGQCSASCGGGIQSRSRYISRPKVGEAEDCEGPLNETQACNEQSCPIDCVLADWSGWSDCDPYCIGTQSRNRIVVTAPEFGGVPCGNLSETQRCTNFCMDCQLSDWTEWASCSKTCAGGSQHRLRDEVYVQRMASLIELQAGSASSTGAWGYQKKMGVRCDPKHQRSANTAGTPQEAEALCSADPTCGGLYDQGCDNWVTLCDADFTLESEEGSCSYLKKEIGQGVPCQGNISETATCNEQMCPVDCVMTEWTDWSPCDPFCNGTQKRERNITTHAAYGGVPCGPSLEDQRCSNFCVDCAWSDWGAWPPCTVSCGGGTAQRSRAIETPKQGGGQECTGSDQETKTCNEQECPVDCELGSWTAWNGCEPYCEGSQTRQRNVTRKAAFGGKSCNALAAEEPDFAGGVTKQIRQCSNPCGPQDCLWSNWTDWGECSASCGGGIQSRDRHIARPKRGEAEDCTGPFNETQACNEKSCPIDCVLADWSGWSDCDPYCVGSQNRNRIVVTAPEFGGMPCGSVSETQRCTNFCMDCQLSDWNDWASCSKTCAGGSQHRLRDEVYVQRSASSLIELQAGSASSTGAWGYQKKMGVRCDPKHQRAGAATPQEAEALCSADPTCGGMYDQGCDNWVTLCDADFTLESEEASCSYLKKEIGQGIPCKGNISETATCNAHTCPVDCVMTDWAEWSACDPFCNGVQTRERNITTHAAFGGVPCGQSLEDQSCSNFCVDCTWSDWGAWSTCTLSCGGGTAQRTRAIETPKQGGGQCTGTGMEDKTCNDEECPVDCELSTWTAWTGCEPYCEGTQMRYRNVTQEASFGGRSCNAVAAEEPDFEGGVTKQIRQCSNECVDCEWGDWAPWSNCSASCQGGTHTRNREVAVPADGGGKQCKGNVTEVGVCADTIACPVDCVMTEWGGWTPCTPYCSGKQQRNRVILTQPFAGGAACGETAEEISCNNTCINCQASSWTDWSECSKTCSGGTQHRSRTILKQAEGEGTPCPDQLEQTKEDMCAPLDCPVNCIWGDWLPWNGCSVTCGEGTQDRTRVEVVSAQYGGTACEGSNREWRACDVEICPVDCQWGPWSAWGNCSATCDSGFQFRNRSVLVEKVGEGADCDGHSEDYEPCAQQGCPRDCVLHDWEPWSDCSHTCGPLGRRKRIRDAESEIEGGRPCNESNEEYEACGLEGCPRNCIWGDWGGWSNCTQSCGKGIAFRNRIQLVVAAYGGNCVGSATQTEYCNDVPCPEDCSWNDWGEWTSCTQSCGGDVTGTKSRLRTKSGPFNAGQECVGFPTETAACNAPGGCSVNCTWEDWNEWTACSRTCSKGTRTRLRFVDTEAYGPLGLNCTGEPSEEELCDTELPCPIDCQFEDWGDWGKCQLQPCGPAQRLRSRERGSAQFGGAPCLGNLSEVEDCEIPGAPPVPPCNVTVPFSPESNKTSEQEGDESTVTNPPAGSAEVNPPKPPLEAAVVAAKEAAQQNATPDEQAAAAGQAAAAAPGGNPTVAAEAAQKAAEAAGESPTKQVEMAVQAAASAAARSSGGNATKASTEAAKAATKVAAASNLTTAEEAVIIASAARESASESGADVESVGKAAAASAKAEGATPEEQAAAAAVAASDAAKKQGANATQAAEVAIAAAKAAGATPQEQASAASVAYTRAGGNETLDTGSFGLPPAVHRPVVSEKEAEEIAEKEPEAVEGSEVLEVSDPETFIHDAAALEAVRDALAEELGVDPDAIIVKGAEPASVSANSPSMLEMGRKSSAMARRQAPAKGEVNITYEVVPSISGKSDEDVVKAAAALDGQTASKVHEKIFASKNLPYAVQVSGLDLFVENKETGAAVLESTITGLNQINQRSGAPPPTLAVPLASVVALFSWF